MTGSGRQIDGGRGSMAWVLCDHSDHGGKRSSDD